MPVKWRVTNWRRQKIDHLTLSHHYHTGWKKPRNFLQTLNTLKISNGTKSWSSRLFPSNVKHKKLFFQTAEKLPFHPQQQETRKQSEMLSRNLCSDTLDIYGKINFCRVELRVWAHTPTIFIVCLAAALGRSFYLMQSSRHMTTTYSGCC